MERPTRHDQALAILELRAHQMASTILGRRAMHQSDFTEAFNVERIDLISAIPDPAALLGLGRNIVGPRDGLYVIAEGDTFHIYAQERGNSVNEHRRLLFEEARDAAVDTLLQLSGIPYVPAG